MTLDERYAAFRASHPHRTLAHGGRTWRYLAGGAGDAVLSLTGALGAADLGFQQIESLEKHFRVIAPDYPPVSSLDEMTAGIVAILDAEGVGRAHVVAGSFGGMVAQRLVRRHPGRVRSLLLSHTAAPGPGGPGRGTIALLSLLPAGLIRKAMAAKLRGSFAGADPFWARYFEATVARLGKADLLSRMRLAAVFAAERYAPSDLDGWTGRVLIVDAEGDPMFTPARRKALRDLYPGAETHTFRGTGHSAAILQPEAYAEVVRAFLERAA